MKRYHFHHKSKLITILTPRTKLKVQNLKPKYKITQKIKNGRTILIWLKYEYISTKD